MTRHERVYRRLLAVYPSTFRERYEEEMVTLFADQLRDAHASTATAGLAGLWLRSLGDVVSTAPGQHLRKEELVPRPLDPGAVVLLGRPANGGLSRTGYAVALVPLWSFAFLRLVAPGFMEPLFLNPPAILGLPAGMVCTFVAGLLMALSVLAMRWARSPAGRTAAFLLLTIPSLIIVVFAPAVILIVLNLKTP